MAISHVSGTEFYVYDGDGERVAKSTGSVDTIYVAGLLEQVVGGATKTYYTMGGQTVAVRDSGTGVVTYLHADHLGSVSLATNATGGVASQQEFDPWGKVRSGGIGQTSLNYTGQRLDGTGLLYYHARNYDPVLARFVSADSVVPGNASGGMDGIALKPLTVDFHEVGFVGSLNGENNQPFWFQMSEEEREKAGSPWGPANTQALNRYSYGLNNPVKYSDPSGHCSAGISWGMVNGQCYQEAIRQYMDPSRSFTDRAIGFIYAQADIALVSVATVATYGLGSAIIGGGATVTAEAGGAAAIAGKASGTVSRYADPKFAAQLERQLARDGMKSILKSLRSLEGRLAEHESKLADLEYKSSVVREIRNFKTQIDTIKQVLKEMEGE
jgi:RHS repeat-associated protein